MFREIFNRVKNESVVKRVENLNSETFAAKLKEDSNAVLIDVRTKSENQLNRIPNSLLLDISDPAFFQKLDKLDKNKNYYLYCRSGNRSWYAGNQMIKLGFVSVYNLQPGIIGWKGEIEQNIL
jgi:rhodanese-related sulfurtransferase